MNKRKEGGNIIVVCCWGNGPWTHEEECNDNEQMGPENQKQKEHDEHE